MSTTSIVPPGTKLSPRDEEIPAWDTLNDQEKALYARQMEAFAGQLAYSDYEFGRILDYLEKIGELDNTIVLFTSDNGREGVTRSFGFTGPWRGTMFSPYEGSLRVPFLVRYPGKIPAGKVSNDIVHQVDLFPTLANFVGGDIPKDRTMDGVDQSAFFTGKLPLRVRSPVRFSTSSSAYWTPRAARTVPAGSSNKEPDMMP